MFSMPRHMVQEDQELETDPFSTSTSTRRWPSILLMGSIVIRFAIKLRPSQPSNGNHGSVPHWCVACQLDAGVNPLFVFRHLEPVLVGAGQDVQFLDGNQIGQHSDGDKR